MNVRRILGASSGAVERALASASCAVAVSDSAPASVAATAEAGLAGVPFRQFGGDAFQRRFGVRQGGAQCRFLLGCCCCFGAGAFGRGGQVGGFLVQPGEGGFGILVERGFARDVVFALGQELAQALRAPSRARASSASSCSRCAIRR